MLVTEVAVGERLVDAEGVFEFAVVLGSEVGLVEFADEVAGGGDGVREYLVLEYAPSKRGAPGDRLFVPTDQLDQVTRYV